MVTTHKRGRAGRNTATATATETTPSRVYRASYQRIEEKQSTWAYGLMAQPDGSLQRLLAGNFVYVHKTILGDDPPPLLHIYVEIPASES